MDSAGDECGGCAAIAAVQKYIEKPEYQMLVKETDEIVSMLIRLQRSLER